MKFTYTRTAIVAALSHFDVMDAAIHAPSNHGMHDRTENSQLFQCILTDLKRAMAQLSPCQAQAVLLHLVLGYAQHEAAALLGISRLGVRNRLNTALRHMEKYLNHPLPGSAPTFPIYSRRQKNAS